MGYNYEKFVKLCENKGIKPSTVSRATGVSTATLSSWKGGKYIPKADKIQLIANYFGVNLDYFSDNQTNSGGEYYTDADTAKIAQEIFENKDLRILFDAAADARPQDLQMAAEMLRRFKETNPNG